MPMPRDVVGRRVELLQLNRVLTGDSERAVVVSGDPGVGKTVLLEQLCTRAAADGWAVLRVLGVQAEEPFALGGLNQMVFGLKNFVADLDTGDRAVLTPVLGGDSDSAVTVLPLVVAALNLLSVAAATRPVLLVADDVHWLDRISAEVLGAVGRRLTDPRVGIVAGQRTPYESVFSSAGWSEMRVAALDAGDSACLLERSGVALSAAARTAILAAAEGNPLALAELPRFGGRIDDNVGALPLTERLVAVFGARLEQLSAPVRAVLLRAALDGIAGSGPSSIRGRYVMCDVGTAINAGLLVVDPFGENVFRHPLVRAAVVHQADPEERREAHRELAGLYDDVLLRRAAHLAAAAVEPDQEIADALAEAATLSVRRGGLVVGVGWLRRAAELSTDQDRRAALIADAVFVAARADESGGQMDLLETAQAGEGGSALTVLAESYRAFHADGEVGTTHRRVIEALAHAEDLDTKTLNRLVYLLVSITNYADSDRYRDQTNAVLLTLKARLDPAVALYRTGIDNIVGTANTVRAILAGYMESLSQVPAQRMVLLSFPAYCAGVMAEFRAPLHAAFTQLCETGPSVDAVECGRVVLLDLIATGHWQQADQVGAACLDMADRIECSQLRRHQLLADLGVLAAGRGDIETARRYAAQVHAWSRPRGLQRLFDSADRIAVRVALAEADYEAAYQAAVRISPAGPQPSGRESGEARLYTGRHEVAEDMFDAVEAALHTGRLDEVDALAAEAVGLNLAEVSPRMAALAMAIAAMAAPDEQAGELYREALGHPGSVEFPFEYARIQLAQGMWLRRTRCHTQARAVLGLAAEGFDHLGASPWADRARAESRAAGAPVQRFPGDTDPLSAQQRRIAELAAAGLTSKEIAAQLSLSPRTIDTHLHRLFRKLGITRRAGLSTALRLYDSESDSAASGSADS